MVGSLFKKRDVSRDLRWFLLALILYALPGLSFAQTPTEIRTWLLEIFRKYPSMMVNVRSEVLSEVASSVLGKERGASLINFAQNSTPEFLSARVQAMREFERSGSTQKRTAVVSGQYQLPA